LETFLTTTMIIADDVIITTSYCSPQFGKKIERIKFY